MRFDRLQRAVKMQRARNEGNNLPFMIQELASLFLSFEETDAADSLNKEAIDFVSGVFVEGHSGHRNRDPLRMSLFLQRAQIKLTQGAIEEAERWMVDADSLLRSFAPPAAALDQWQSHQCAWGQLYLRQGRYVDSERALLSCRGTNLAEGTVAPIRGPENDDVPLRTETPAARTGQAALDLVRLYEGWGRRSEAERHRGEARQFQQVRDSLRSEYRARFVSGGS